MVRLKFKKHRMDILCVLILTVAMILIVLYELDFTNRDFTIYETLEGDHFGICATIQAIREEGLGAAFFIHRWGAPEISSELCNPSIDLLTTAGLWIVGFFTPNSACTFYMYFILTFVLCALCMYLFLRIVGIRSCVSSVISAMYSLVPYHFLRISHTAFIGYYTIPLCMIILYYIIDLDSSKSQSPNWLLFLCALIVGLGNPYYFFFGLILFALAYIVIFIKGTQRSHSIKAWVNITFSKYWSFFLMCSVFLFCQLPRIIYLSSLNINYNAVGRYPCEAEIFGLKLIQLLLPAPYHNNKLLQNATYFYNTSGVSINENTTTCLGLLGVIGFVILLWRLCRNFVSGAKVFKLIDFLALSTLLLLLVGTIGGLGTVFNYLITAQFRAYNRISIFISCLCLTGIAIVFDQILSKNRTAGIITIASALVVGFYDQVPFTPLFVYNAQNSDRQKQLENFFSEVESNLEMGEMIYQLPHMQFPENGNINNLSDASHFQGYLFTNSLRWSYGGIKGINTAAEKLYLNNGMSESFLDALINAGFSGVYINTMGYDDNGKKIKSFYETRGLTPIVSEDGTLLFYNICDITIDQDKVYQERTRIPGYGFIQDISSFCGKDITSAECALLAEKMRITPLDVTQEIYNWLVLYGVNDMNNADYINLLYTKILGRPSVKNEESNYWIEALEDESQDRFDILNGFILSEEFRSKYNLIEFLVYDTNSDVINFTSDNYNADEYIINGMSYSENTYAWSEGNEIGFQKLKLADSGGTPFLLNLSISGTYNGEQKIIIFCNKKEVYNATIDTSTELIIPITTDSQGMIHITISLPNAISPKEIGESADDRKLAIQFDKIQIRNYTTISEK